MAEYLSDYATCEAIRFVSTLVDPIEIAAEHPLMQRLTRDRSIESDEAIDLFEIIGTEFIFDPDQLQAAWQIGRDAVWGDR